MGETIVHEDLSSIVRIHRGVRVAVERMDDVADCTATQENSQANRRPVVGIEVERFDRYDLRGITIGLVYHEKDHFVGAPSNAANREVWLGSRIFVPGPRPDGYGGARLADHEHASEDPIRVFESCRPRLTRGDGMREGDSAKTPSGWLHLEIRREFVGFVSAVLEPVILCPAANSKDVDEIAVFCTRFDHDEPADISVRHIPIRVCCIDLYNLHGVEGFDARYPEANVIVEVFLVGALPPPRDRAPCRFPRHVRRHRPIDEVVSLLLRTVHEDQILTHRRPIPFAIRMFIGGSSDYPVSLVK